MDRLTIADLEVFCQIGITDVERAAPQRLLITVEMLHNFTHAAAQDDLAQTIDYAAVSERLLRLSKSRQWKLIETLASDLAAMLLNEFGGKTVFVEVKKFVIPQARFVAVSVTRSKRSQDD